MAIDIGYRVDLYAGQVWYGTYYGRVVLMRMQL